MRRVEHKVPLFRHMCNLTAGNNSAQGKSVSERLAERQDVWYDSLVVDCEKVTTTTERSLRFIDNEKHAPFLTVFFHSCHITYWEGDDTSRAEYWLHNHCCQGAD